MCSERYCHSNCELMVLAIDLQQNKHFLDLYGMEQSNHKISKSVLIVVESLISYDWGLRWQWFQIYAASTMFGIVKRPGNSPPLAVFLHINSLVY